VVKVWQKLQPTGVLSDLTITHTGTNFKDNQFSIATQFEGLSWEHWEKLPGVSNLSGTLNLTPDSGTVILNTAQTQFDFGNLFRQPLAIDKLTGKFVWQKIANVWQIQANDVALQNPVLSVHGDASLLIPQGKDSPMINILAGFNLN